MFFFLLKKETSTNKKLLKGLKRDKTAQTASQKVQTKSKGLESEQQLLQQDVADKQRDNEITRFKLLKHFYKSESKSEESEEGTWGKWATDISIVSEKAEVYPVLRPKLRQNRMGRVLMDHVPMMVGNELLLPTSSNSKDTAAINHKKYLSTISLRQYLQNINEYLSSDIVNPNATDADEKDVNEEEEEEEEKRSSIKSSTSKTKQNKYQFQLLCDANNGNIANANNSPIVDDNYVLVQKQCAVIDVADQSHRFNPIYHQKNVTKNTRAVFVLIATSFGTSAQVLEGLYK
ncbi:hypothetical protein RFI_24184 [Reticulomyxa filosa]|uniref:Uncharacterized protein n=1 Tax=Reticulomyxa filosa TaxID=46433 RepID=X6MIC1_RETFI|nr:hypothetical protein RFI_24184 [Reticulomyxa filosa]|eukprot:ETO13192.1 hypothetical protein RFI_24184 [Reticulomyxa filosa]